LQPPGAKVECIRDAIGAGYLPRGMTPDSTQRRPLTVTGLAVALAFSIGCKQAPKRTPAQETGDAFVEHYLHADQQGALPYAALGAQKQLETELASVKDARDQASPDIHATWKRTGEETRGQRTVLLYQVEPGEQSPPRTLRLELSDLGKGPKVVLFELR
jgi:hypothetical protein